MRSIGPAIVFVGLLSVQAYCEIHAAAQWSALPAEAKNLMNWFITVAGVMFVVAFIKDMLS